MRKALIPAFFALAAILTGAYAGTPINQTQLPKEARNFIARYFSAEKVKKVEKEQGHRGMEYEVDFTSGAEVGFREDGTWKDVKAAKGKTVPAAIVPTAIANYVKTSHSGQTIVEISRKRGGYEVELSNGKELHLTADAKPVTDQGRGRRGNRPGK